MTNIDFNNFDFAKYFEEKVIGVSFEKIPPKREFCDVVTFYYDSKVLFARYCYGESAGVVASMVGEFDSKTGEIKWDFDNCYYSRKNEAPVKLYATNQKNSLFFDDQPYEWFIKKQLKKDKQNGYGFFKILFRK